MEVFGLFRLLKQLSELTPPESDAEQTSCVPPEADTEPAFQAKPIGSGSDETLPAQSAETDYPEDNRFLSLLERHNALSKKIDRAQKG